MLDDALIALFTRVLSEPSERAATFDSLSDVQRRSLLSASRESLRDSLRRLMPTIVRLAGSPGAVEALAVELQDRIPPDDTPSNVVAAVLVAAVAEIRAGEAAQCNPIDSGEPNGDGGASPRDPVAPQGEQPPQLRYDNPWKVFTAIAIKSRYGKQIIALALSGVVIFAVWNSLPDSTKVNILRYLTVWQGPRRELRDAIRLYARGTPCQWEKEKTRASFLELAKTERPVPKMWVARLLLEGRCGFSKSPEKAQKIAIGVFSQIKDLADAGDRDAMFVLASAFQEGLGTGANCAEAIRWYEKAAAERDTLAMCNLGAIWLAGCGDLAADSEKALKWYMDAAQIGDAYAMTEIGCMHDDQQDGPYDDPQQAIKWYQKGIQKGDTFGRAYLGAMYSWDPRVRDVDKAMTLLERAAEECNPLGMKYLGDLYRDGIGVPRNCDKAKEWYQRAIDFDEPAAMTALGRLKMHGCPDGAVVD